MSFRIQIGSACRSCAGQSVCGDRVGIFRRGYEVVVAVADGLGHGPEADKAAGVACEYVKKNRTSDVGSLMQGLDEALVRTRGAAVTIVHIDIRSGQLCHAGVGNVQLSARSKTSINAFPTPGVLGRGIRKVMVTKIQLYDGDFFVIYTDGISSRFKVEDYFRVEPQRAADELIEKWSKVHDDATCVTFYVRS